MPIESIVDSNAWHVVLLGIRPNDDVDKGPIRQDEREPAQSPFGDKATSATSGWQSTSLGSLRLQMDFCPFGAIVLVPTRIELPQQCVAQVLQPTLSLYAQRLKLQI